MMIRLIPLVTVAALLLAGCDKSASETSKDVQKARQEASEDVSAARQEASKKETKATEKVTAAQHDYDKANASAHEELSETESEAMITMAKADFDVAMTEAEGRHSISIEKCDMLNGVDKKACVSSADAKLAVEKAKATADRDAILVKADRVE